ncbi:MAG: thiolase family protein [Sphingomonadaceae bacterium]
MEDVVIVGAARTPVGKLLGSLSSVPATRLGAVAIRAALDRAGVDPVEVDEVVMGHVLTAGVGMAPARQAAISAGVPERASALTVNKVCASGLAAVVVGAREVATRAADVVVAGGMENMSQAPHLIRGSRAGLRLGPGELVDSAISDGLWCAWENHHMGNSAEEIARKYGLAREQQDALALESHRKAVAATDSGRFRPEIVGVEVREKTGPTLIEIDEGPRRDTSMEALARLAPSFERGGTVTAGNSPGLSDGAAALVLASDSRARERGWPVRARITGCVSANLEPRWLFDAPAEAVKRLLERTGLALEDVDLIEINEAFAATVLAAERVLGWDRDRVNVKGGALALGHPIGCSGARILVTLLHSLEEMGLHRGIAVLCHGGGGAVAVSVER